MNIKWRLITGRNAKKNCILSIHHKGWCWGSKLFPATRFTTFFGKIRDSVPFYTLFCVGKKVHTKKPLRFLNCWYFCLVQFYWLYFITFCAYYLGQWMYVCKPCHAFFAHFPRNLTIKKSLRFRCHFEWISPWKCRESVRWWRSLWVSLSARSRFGPAQATLNLGLRRFSWIRPDYSQVSNS